MDLRRIEWTPLALYALAGCTLVCSSVAWRMRATEPLRVLAHQMRQHGSASHRTAIATRNAFPKPESLLPGQAYRPVLNALAAKPADYVQLNGVPLRAPVVQPMYDLEVLTPGEPLWSAAHAQALASQRAQAFDSARRIGRAIAAMNNRIRRIAPLRPVLRTLVKKPESPRGTPTEDTITSPPSLTGPLIIGPGDRLAMAIERAGAKPSLSVRQRRQPLLIEPTHPQQHSHLDPAALREQLTTLLDIPAAASLAEEALWVLESIVQSGDLQGQPTNRLAEIADQTRRLAEEAEQGRTAVLLRKAGYAIDRRVGAWRIAGKVAQRNRLAKLPHQSIGEKLAASGFSGVSAGDGNYDDAWRRHLASLHMPLSAEEQSSSNRLLMRDILSQIAKARSLQSGEPMPYGETASIGNHIYETIPTVDVNDLLGDIEQYEQDAKIELAHRIAMRRRQLARAGGEEQLRLANRIDQDYRNANLRVAIADALIRRQLPRTQPQVQNVADRIAGTPVRGTANTSTDLNIRLTPDPHAWRLTLQASGRVNSRTVAFGGPASLHTLGEADFVAEKPIVIQRSGVSSQSADCVVSSRSHLVGVRTRYDGLPIVENIIRSRARGEFQQSQGRARRETEQRVSERVNRTLDEQSMVLIEKLKQRYHTELISRANALGMEVEPIEVRTTNTRLIARLRVAGEEQLAAHTPRNRAPSDSVASLQLHESVLNNAIAGIDLGRGSMSPEELQEIVREKLGLRGAAKTEQEPHEVRVQFASTQPVRVTLHEGRAAIVLAINELIVDRSRFRNFKVHAYFAASASTQGLWLTQTDPVQIEGKMRSSRRAKLHGVFSKVLPAGKQFSLASTTPEQREKLAGLMVTQLVIDDGWIGVAIGPQRTGRVASRDRFLR